MVKSQQIPKSEKQKNALDSVTIDHLDQERCFPNTDWIIEADTPSISPG